MIDQRITRFIRRHHVLTLATADETGAPYCSNAFYAYDAARNRFVFAGNPETRHVGQFRRRPEVAASIPLETRIIGKIQGLQLCGTVEEADAADSKVYLRRFPYTAIADLRLWALVPAMLKFTDNTLGFGKKLIWNKEE